jgi:hypothetical protein
MQNEESYSLQFSDGRIFQIEQISYGTNHDIGTGNAAVFYFRKIPLLGSFANKLDRSRGQSQLATPEPALVIWYFVQDRSKTNYINSQVMEGAFIDEHGDAYRPYTTCWSGSPTSFNRRALIFYAFPRWQDKLKLQVSSYDVKKAPEYKTIEIFNPVGKAKPAQWESENLPANHRLGSLEISLEKLVIRTNSQRSDLPILWWEPELKTMEDGGPMKNWEDVEWEAIDAAGNHGNQLGVHQPILKFAVSLWPKPEMVIKEVNRWQLPLLTLQTNQPMTALNLNSGLGSVSLHVYGVFGPGAYSFCEGQLTNSPTGIIYGNYPGWHGTGKEISPGKWKNTHTHYTTNFTCYVRQEVFKPKLRLGIILRDGEGHVYRSVAMDSKDGIQPYVFQNLPPELKNATPEIVLLEAAESDFVVKPPLETIK